MIQKSGSDINRVAPLSQIHLNNRRSFTNRLIHHRSRTTRVYPAVPLILAQDETAVPFQLNRSRCQGRRLKRNRVRAAKPGI